MVEVDEFSSCPTLVELIRSRRTVGRTGKMFEGLGALSSVNNLMTLRHLIHELKPVRTLEIGLSFAGSGLVFTSSHRDLGKAPAKQHVAIDPFQDSVWDDCGILAVERAGLDNYLDFRKSLSSVELPALSREGATFGLIYIDGSHLFEDVFVDAYFAARLLADGGVVAFDDSTDPHVQKVLRFLRTNCGNGLEEIDLGPYRSDRGTTFRYRFAKMLKRVQMTAFRRVGKIDRSWNASFYRF